jgi:hypothetical protein
MVDDDRINAALANLDEEERIINQKVNGLRERLAQVQSARDVLLALRSEDPTEFSGKLVDACRAVLRRRAGHSFSPTEIRDAVKALGYDFSQHGNPMAAVHGVLKRLNEQQEIKTKTRKTGTRYYVPEETIRAGAFSAVGSGQVTAHGQRLHAAYLTSTGSPPIILEEETRKKGGASTTVPLTGVSATGSVGTVSARSEKDDKPTKK